MIMKNYFLKLKQLLTVKDLSFTLLIFAIILTMAFCKGETMMDVTFGNEAVDIVTDRYSMNIPYDLVESIEIAEYSEEDEPINGRSDIALQTGIWKNESWGEYYSCIDLQTSKCILVHLNDGRLFVFSHESDRTVQAEYEKFLEHLNR